MFIPKWRRWVIILLVDLGSELRLIGNNAQSLTSPDCSVREVVERKGGGSEDTGRALAAAEAQLENFEVSQSE